MFVVKKYTKGRLVDIVEYRDNRIGDGQHFEVEEGKFGPLPFVTASEKMWCADWR